MSALKPSASKRNAGLDVVRCIAIFLVLFAHSSTFFPMEWIADYKGLYWSLGVLGNEIFFALSGLLIGSILLEIQETGIRATTIRRFLVRRWIRTLPLYFATLIVLTIFVKLDPNDRTYVWQYYFLSQNLFNAMQGTWFGPSWSLVVEEWSYVLFPILVFACSRATHRPVFIVAFTLCLFGFINRCVLHDSHYSWDECIRKIFLMRIDAISYGVLAACALYYDRSGKEVTKWALRLAPLSIGFVAITFFVCAVHYTRPNILQAPFAQTLMLSTTGLGFACLVVLAPSLKVPAWAQPPVRFFAKISYAVYLVHWPLLFVVGDLSKALRMPVFIALTIAIATFVSYVLEQPLMKMRPRQFEST